MPRPDAVLALAARGWERLIAGDTTIPFMT